MNDTPPADPTTESETAPAWGALNRIERRVVGVLVEKSKTTPDVYPMTVNSLANGANQKSNRYPRMDLKSEQVEDALLRLRQRGAVIEVLGDGRVSKYKHALYEWLGVDKEELAVMAELLLRGQQSLGDLRARASRMNPIANQEALQTLLDGLLEKQLVIEVTPRGRGQIVSHNLYHEQELDKVRAAVAADHDDSSRPSSSEMEDRAPLETRVAALEKEVAQLKQMLEELMG